MERRELLIYILGYLNGINTTSKISSDKIQIIKEVINGYHNRNIPEVERDIDNYNDYENSDYDDYSLYNNPDYNDEMDLDQQSPDFEF